MSSTLKDRLESSGIRDLWQRRAEGLKEQLLLEQQLAELREEISLLDRWMFFHATEAEAGETKVKARLKDLHAMVAQTSAEIDKFWTELCRDRPEIASVRALEEALLRCLLARTADGVKAALDACRALLEPALEAAGDHPPQEALEPDRALDLVFRLPQQAYLIPLSALAALLQHGAPSQEATWIGSRSTLVYRPVVILLVGKVMEAYSGAFPDNPFPIDIISGWMEKDQTALPPFPESLRESYPPSKSQEELAELVGLFHRLAGHDLALRLNRSEISFFDRVVFWSDTPAEAREKLLISELAALGEEATSEWLDLERRLRGKRRELWPIYSADQALVLRDAVRAIATAEGEASKPKTCPLLNQEKAIWQAQAFANEVSQRFGPIWKREALLDEALQAEGDPATLAPQDGFLPVAQLPIALGPRLHESGFPERYQAMRDALLQTETNKDELREARGLISTWDRINVFKETEAEAREKAMTAAVSEGQERAIALRQTVEQELETALLDLHQPALAGTLLDELTIALDQVRAECASYTRSYEDSDGDTRYETVYCCVLRGIDLVNGLLSRVLSCSQPQEGTYLPLFEAAELWTLLDSDRARSVYALSLSGS